MKLSSTPANSPSATLALVGSRQSAPTCCQSPSVGEPMPTPGICRICVRRPLCARDARRPGAESAERRRRADAGSPLENAAPRRAQPEQPIVHVRLHSMASHRVGDRRLLRGVADRTRLAWASQGESLRTHDVCSMPIPANPPSGGSNSTCDPGGSEYGAAFGGVNKSAWSSRPHRRSARAAPERAVVRSRSDRRARRCLVIGEPWLYVVSRFDGTSGSRSGDRAAPDLERYQTLSAPTLWSRLARAVRRALELLARPVRRARGKRGFVLQPYRGYGSRDEAFLIGRVFRQPTFGSGPGGGVVSRQLIDVLRGLLRRGVADAAVMARFYGAEQRVTTDRDGYFRVHMRPAQPIGGGLEEGRSLLVGSRRGSLPRLAVEATEGRMVLDRHARGLRSTARLRRSRSAVTSHSAPAPAHCRNLSSSGSRLRWMRARASRTSSGALAATRPPRRRRAGRDPTHDAG